MKKTAYSLIKEADRKIKKKYKYFCGIVEDASGLKDEDAILFFESPDRQDYELYSLLIDLGFKNLDYNAPYGWRVKLDNEIVSYIEGDIYIKNLYK